MSRARSSSCLRWRLHVVLAVLPPGRARPWEPGTVAGVGLAAACLVAGLLAAPDPAPQPAARSLTARTGWNYTEAAGYSLSPAQLIGWLIPGFFGRGPQFHWGAWPRVEVGYLGILPLILATLAVALLGRGRDRRIWPWVGLAAVSLRPRAGHLCDPARLVDAAARVRTTPRAGAVCAPHRLCALRAGSVGPRRAVAAAV